MTDLLTDNDLGIEAPILSDADVGLAGGAPKKRGAVANLGAGLNDFLAGTAGMPVDLAAAFINRAKSAPYFATDAQKAQDAAENPPITDPFGGSASIRKAMGYVGANPEDVQATTPGEKFARAAGAGAGAVLAPAGSLAGMAANAAAGVSGGLTGEAAAEMLPKDSSWEPTARVVGNMLGATGPAAVTAAFRQGLANPEAAQRYLDLKASGITPRPATVAQNRGVSGTSNYLRDMPILGAPLDNAVQEDLAAAAAGSERNAAQFGKADSPLEGGRALQKGATQWKYGPAEQEPVLGVKAPEIPVTSNLETQTHRLGFVPVANALYGDIPINGVAPAFVDKTIAALRRLQSQYPSNPELGKALQNPDFAKWANALEGKVTPGAPGYAREVPQTPVPEVLPKDGVRLPEGGAAQIDVPPTPAIQTGGLSWDDLKNFRSLVGRAMRQPTGQFGMGPDDFKHLYGAISDDMRNTAASNGALPQFERANAYYSDGLDHLKNVLDFIDKAPSAENAMAGLMAKGANKGASADIVGFKKAMESLPEDLRGDVASTVISRLGTPTEGQSFRGDFSINSWSTNYAKISDGAKDVLFGAKGSDYRDNLDTLSRSIDAMKGVGAHGNSSGTGRYANIGHVLETLGGVATASVNPFAPMAIAAAHYTGAKVLASPTMARWLAQVGPIKTQAGWANQLTRLSSLAERDPTAKDYQTALARVVSGDASQPSSQGQ